MYNDKWKLISESWKRYLKQQEPSLDEIEELPKGDSEDLRSSDPNQNIQLDIDSKLPASVIQDITNIENPDWETMLDYEYKDRKGETYLFDFPESTYFTGVKTAGYPCYIRYGWRKDKEDFLWFDETNRKVVMSIEVYKPETATAQSNLRAVKWANAGKSIRGQGVGAYKFYKSLIANFDITLMSDNSQTRGAEKIWKKLIKDKSIVAEIEYREEPWDDLGYSYGHVWVDEHNNFHSDIGDPWISRETIDDYVKRNFPDDPNERFKDDEYVHMVTIRDSTVYIKMPGKKIDILNMEPKIPRNY